MEEIHNWEEQQEWTLQQMPVPPQTDGGSCGYGMLYNTSQLCKQQEPETIEEEESALGGCMIEAINMLKEEQQGTMRREEGQGGKKARQEKVKKAKQGS